MQVLRQQINLAVSAEANAPGGSLRCACVNCGYAESFGSKGQAAAAGWRALGGNQSQLACPSCLAERDRRSAGQGNRRTRLAMKAIARRAG